MPRKPLLSPHAGMVLVTIFWAGNFTAMKLAFTQLEPLVFTALRFTIASVVLWFIVRHVEGPAPIPRRAIVPLIWLGVLGNTIYQYCFMMGLFRTSATKSALVLAGMPVLVTIAAGVLGIERVTHRQRVAVIVATIGVVTVILGRGGSIGGGFGTGELALLGAVVVWAIYTLLLRHWSLPISPLRVTAWTMYTGTPGLVLLGLPGLMRTNWHAVTMTGWGGLLYAALLSLVASYILWNRGVAELGAARTVVYNTVTPLFATAIAVVGLGERPGLVHLFGAVMIVSGVLLTRRAVAPEG